MNRRWRMLASILFFLLGIGWVFSVSHAQSPQKEFVQDEVLVKFFSSTSNESRKAIHERLKTKVKQRIDALDVDVVGVDTGSVLDKIVDYKKDKDVEYAEPNYIATVSELTSDPKLADGTQWGMFKTQAAATGSSAWNYAKSDASVKVAILDTGIDQDHSDLSSKIVANKNCTSSSTVDDLYGHGTHVAGIAAATTNNAAGVAGMGYNASLMNVKVLGDDGSGAYSWIASCLTWAADNGARVVNMSLGGSFNSQTLQNAVNYAWNKGVVLAAAAGNNGSQAASYPAYYSKVIAVAATDSNDKKASWSNFGKWVDVAAPGVSIYSTLPNHATIIGALNYGSLSGTSMASPHVAGLAALIWPTPYGGSNSNVRKQIEGTADKIAGTGKQWTYGRINALKAVTSQGAYNGKTHN